MYGKFFASTFTGSMFGAGPDVFAVWAYVIAHTVDGRVELNPDVLMATLGASRERIDAAITFLCSPDDRSRNPAEEGRRLVQDGQFQFRVTSHALYRTLRNESDRRAYNREKQRESRARRGLLVKSSQAVKRNVKDVSHGQPPSAYTEAEAEAEAETEKNTPPPPSGGGTRRSAPGGSDLTRFWDSEWVRTRLGQTFAWERPDAVAMAACLKLAKNDPAEVHRRITTMLDSQDHWIAENASPRILRSYWNRFGVTVLSKSAARQAELNAILTRMETPNDSPSKASQPFASPLAQPPY